MLDPKRLDHARLADALLPSILGAGRIQLDHAAAGIKAESKADRSPVTAADRESEELLLAALAAAAPGVPVIAEEAAAAGHLPSTGAAFFLVDPLDGTREYVAGSKEYTVNVALVVDGAPVFGIIYAPAMAWLFMTVGAQRSIEAEVAPDAAVSRLSELTVKEVRTRDPVPDALIGVASRSYKSAKAAAFLDRLGVRQRKPIGSSLKFCLVARGDADVYPRFGAISEWDTAAGHALLLAAGGAVTTLDGRDLRYGKLETKYVNPPFVAWGRRSLIVVE